MHEILAQLVPHEFAALLQTTINIAILPCSLSDFFRKYQLDSHYIRCSDDFNHHIYTMIAAMMLFSRIITIRSRTG